MEANDKTRMTKGSGERRESDRETGGVPGRSDGRNDESDEMIDDQMVYIKKSRESRKS